ncbi:MAG: Crp/Fnr family transcriptional regulator [Oscillospiraceae bacterium]
MFQGFTEGELTEMLGCLDAKTACFAKRETILSEGDPIHALGIVLSGSVQVVQVDYFGNRSIVTNLEPSDLFAESFVCAGVEKMPVQVASNEDGTAVLWIDRHRILRPCGKDCGLHQGLMDNLLKIAATKNLVLHQKVEILSKRTTREKLMAYLLLQAKKNHASSFTIPFDRQELADYLGVDRSGLSAEIGRLRREGIFNCERNHFELL